MTAGVSKWLNKESFDVFTEVKLCTLIGGRTLQSAAIRISLSGTSNVQNFVRVCMHQMVMAVCLSSFRNVFMVLCVTNLASIN